MTNSSIFSARIMFTFNLLRVRYLKMFLNTHKCVYVCSYDNVIGINVEIERIVDFTESRFISIHEDSV